MKIGFDFDQTLADTSLGIADTLGFVLDELKIKYVSPAIMRTAESGKSLKEMLSLYVPFTQLARAEEIYMEKYPVIGLSSITLFPFVTELVTDLIATGFKVVIVSAKKHANLKLAIEKLQLQVDDYYGSAPASEKHKKFLELGIKCYVGDQPTDMEAAWQSKIPGILISNNKEYPRNAIEPDYIFKDIEDLYKNLAIFSKIQNNI